MISYLLLYSNLHTRVNVSTKLKNIKILEILSSFWIHLVLNFNWNSLNLMNIIYYYVFNTQITKHIKSSDIIEYFNAIMNTPKSNVLEMLG